MAGGGETEVVLLIFVFEAVGTKMMREKDFPLSYYLNILYKELNKLNFFNNYKYLCP